ncbi:MAG: hypothetical protein VX464_20875 [Pseudomonadota bacterium]|nr:hypothetical protein [Pseudomonadota bacterium]
MKQALCHLRSISPYSQSKGFTPDMPKPERGKADEYDKTHWRKKCHATKDGKIFIPPMAFKMGLDAAAKLKGQRVPGKGQATYTKRFLSGVLVLDGLTLPIHVDDVEHDDLFVNADGVRGSGKRVWKRFPRIDEWEGEVCFHIMSDEIPEEVFESTLDAAGKFVGIGRFRPESGGFYGRYEVVSVDWQDE